MRLHVHSTQLFFVEQELCEIDKIMSALRNCQNQRYEAFCIAHVMINHRGRKINYTSKVLNIKLSKIF